MTTAVGDIFLPGIQRTLPGEIEELISGGNLIVGNAQGKTVACAKLRLLPEPSTPAEGLLSELGMLTVDMQWQHKRIGHHLMQFAEHVAMLRGAQFMELQLLLPKTWVHKNKEFLKKWYSRRGFAKVAERDFIKDFPRVKDVLACDVDYWIYHKRLGSDA